MNKRLGLNLALAGIIIALALVVILEPGKDKAAESPKLTTLSVELLTRAVIERTGRDTVVLEKQRDHWRVAQPLNMIANDFRVNAVLRTAQAPSYAQFPLAGRDLKQYELDQPKVRLTLGEHVIEFGGVNPLDQRRYARVGDTVHLIGEDNFTRLSGDAISFVSSALVPEHQQELTQIKLPQMTVSRDETGKWTATPSVEKLSADDINKFVDEWRHAQALLVAAYSGKPTGETVVLSFSGPTAPLTFDLLSKDGDLILGRKDVGVQYQFTSETRQRMFTPAPAPVAIPPDTDKN